MPVRLGCAKLKESHQQKGGPQGIILAESM